MSDFLSSTQAYQSSAFSWLSEQQRAADAVWQRFSLPTRKTEDWKYTNLSKLSKCVFSPVEKAAANVKTALPEFKALESLVGSRVVFVDGHFDLALSQIKEESGVELLRFSDADEKQQADISNLLNKGIDFEKHGFAALNTKCINDGLWLRVAKSHVVAQPIHVVHLVSDEGADVSINSRLLVSAEASSKLTVIEHFWGGAGENDVFRNSITELDIHENAELNYYRLMEESECVQHISGVHCHLARASRLNSFYLALGTALTRVDVSVNFNGEGAEASMDGVYLPKNKQHIDIHTCIEHAVPHCQSHQVFRGIISDQARAVFNGRIHIHKDAQKTEAYLSNKNLLTSNKAEVDTKPELEIYADDVRCAHGATIAQLDETSMHYLKTRGISEDEARVMLSFGFINALLEALPLTDIADYCRPILAARFSRDEHLTRHLG